MRRNPSCCWAWLSVARLPWLKLSAARAARCHPEIRFRGEWQDSRYPCRLSGSTWKRACPTAGRHAQLTSKCRRPRRGGHTARTLSGAGPDSTAMAGEGRPGLGLRRKSSSPPTNHLSECHLCRLARPETMPFVPQRRCPQQRPKRSGANLHRVPTARAQKQPAAGRSCADAGRASGPRKERAARILLQGPDESRADQG